MTTKTHIIPCVAAAFGLLVPAVSEAQILFQSNLDSSTGWVVLQEATNPSSLATFGYDYSALGIPASPNSGGSTLGLRLAANGTGLAVQAITAATTATFSGQFRVTFDFWGNYGGSSTTEYMGGGVGFSGTLPRKGASILTTVDGGSVTDWRLDRDAASQTLGSGFYNPLITSLDVTAATSADPNFFFTGPFPGQTAPPVQGNITALSGTLAFGWHTMTILADSTAGTASFTIDSTNIGTIDQHLGAVSIAGSGSLTLLDSFTSVSNPDLTADRVFVVFDNYKVEAVPEPSVASLVGISAFGLFRRRRNSA